MDAAVGYVLYGTSNVQGPNPLCNLQRHGKDHTPIMANPIPTTNPADYGSFPNYLAARVDGPRAAWGMSRTETTGLFAKTEEGEHGGEESATTG